MIVTAVSCPPGISFYTLPQLFIWKDWIEGQPGYRFGANRVPSGSFDDSEAIAESGWTDVSFQNDQIEHEIEIAPRKEPPRAEAGERRKPRGKKDEFFEDEVIADSDRVIKLSVAWKNREEFDIVGTPFLDFPMAAIRSPSIRVQANNLIQISVLVKRSVCDRPRSRRSHHSGFDRRRTIPVSQQRAHPGLLPSGPLSQGPG